MSLINKVVESDDACVWARKGNKKKRKVMYRIGVNIAECDEGPKTKALVIIFLTLYVFAQPYTYDSDP